MTHDTKTLTRLLDLYARDTKAGSAAWAELESHGPALASEVLTLRKRVEAVEAVVAKRSEPVMDPPWTAAYNAALDAVSAALSDTGEQGDG